MDQLIRNGTDSVPALLMAALGLFALQLWQTARFLRLYEGPTLTWPVTLPTFIIYLITTASLAGSSFPVTLRAAVILVLAVPLTLTDLRCRWLPMRFTMLFWLGGLISAFLPGSTLSVTSALVASISAFILTQVVRWLANHRADEERMGQGDVYLMAGLYAWLPWQSACHAAAGGLFLCCGFALVARQSSVPFAPALFAFMSAVSIFFPSILPGVL